MNKPRADKFLSENMYKDNFGKADLNDHTYAKSYKKSMAVDSNDSVSDSYESESDESIKNKNKTDTSDRKTSQKN